MNGGLQIRTLGGAHVLRNDTAVTAFASRKVVALLIYLACTKQAHPREILAELFWENRTQSQSLANLRVALTSLRQTVGDFVTITRQTVAINTEADVWLDAAAFEAALAAGQMEQAVALYQGDFLAGFYVDSDTFEGWALHERERLGFAIIDALDRLIADCEAQQDYTEGIAQATRLLELDPLREVSHRHMMRLLALNGYRSAALEQYEKCRQVLADELGIPPAAPTDALHEQIRDGQIAPPAKITRAHVEAVLIHEIAQIPTRSPPPNKLFGRDALLEDVEHLLASRGHVLLQGFAGVGKTAMAAVLVERTVSVPDQAALWINAGRRDADSILEALAGCLRAGPLESKRPSEQRQLIGDLLERHRVRLVVLDDVQDGSTLDQVRLLLPATFPVLVTSRNRYPLLPLVNVPCLARPDALCLLNAYAQHPNDDGHSADDLCEILGDLPFALRIAGIQLALDALTPQELLVTITDIPHAMTMPQGFEQGRASLVALLQDSMATLSSNAQETLLAFGRLHTPTATTDLLALVMDHDPRVVLAALKELRRRGLAEYVPTPGGEISCYSIHCLVYSYASDKTEVPRGEDTAVMTACRSYVLQHIEHADDLHVELGNILGATNAAFDAGRDALVLDIMRPLIVDSPLVDVYGHTLALLDCLKRAVKSAQRMGDMERETLHYLLSKCGNLYYQRGDLHTAVWYYEQAGEVAHALKWKERRIIALCVAGKVHSELGNAKVAVDKLKQAYHLATELGDDGLITRVLENHAVHSYTHKDFTMARELSQQEVTIAERIGNPRRLYYGLLNWGAAEQELGHFAQSILRFEHALAIAREEQVANWIANALFGLGISCVRVGSTERAADILYEAIALCETSGYLAKAEEIRAYVEEQSAVLGKKQ